MITVDISEPLGTVVFDAASPRNDYETGIQRTNDEGVPMWRVAAILRQEDARQSEQIAVVVPSRTNPADEIQPFTPVAFEGLRMMTGQGNNGSTWVSFHADKVSPVAAGAAHAAASGGQSGQTAQQARREAAKAE